MTINLKKHKSNNNINKNCNTNTITMILTRKALIDAALSTLKLDQDTGDCRTTCIFSSHFGFSIEAVYNVWNTLFFVT
jgi:hypothetical protein